MTQYGRVEAGEADYLMVAVHEAGHLGGIGNEYGPGNTANFEALLTLEERAFGELKNINYSAPLSYLRLKNWGRQVKFYRPKPPKGG